MLAKTRKFTTLDSSLLLRNNGERTVLSNRVAELDRLVPEKLGVSAAVLDSVIFCHQDESLWPMSEPLALKKRFDEIFEAMKYTKVIDNLKTVRKAQGETLRMLLVQEAQDRANMERADKVDRLMTQLTREIQESREKCNEILEQMDEESVRIKDKYAQANSFLKIVNDLATKVEKLEYKREAIQELKGRIEQMAESDQELRSALDEYERTTERTIAARDEKAKQFHELQGELKVARGQHTAKAAEQGKHQSDKDKYDRQLVQRVQMIKDAADRHEIRGYDGDLNDGQVSQFFERIQKLWAEKKRDLVALQRENAAELDKLAGVIAERESRKSALQQDRSSASRRMATISRDIASLQAELGALDIDEGAEAVLRNDLKELEARIETAKAEERTADLDGQIRSANDNIWKLEAEAAKLSRELVDCTRLASERAQLDLRKKQLTERRRDLDILKNTWNEKLSAVIGPGWQPENIESEYQNAVRRLAATVGECRKKKDSTQQELKQIEFKLSTARERKTKMATEMDRCKAAIVKALQAADSEDISVENYLAHANAVEEALSEGQQHLKLFDELKKFWDKIRGEAVKKNCCHICERGFGNDVDKRDKLVKKIEKKVSNEEKEETAEYVKDKEQEHAAMRKARPHYDIYRRLEGELPPLTKEISAMASQRDELVRELENHDDAFRQAEEKRLETEALSKNVLKIAQTFKDIADSERQIERSQQSSTVQMRSPEEINDEQTTCADQTRVAQAQLSKLTTDRQRIRDLISQLEMERAELRHKISNAANQLERKKSLQESIRRSKEEQGHLRDSIQSGDRDIAALEPEIVSARAALDEARRQTRAKEQRVAEERDAIATTVSELKMTNSEIEEYLERGGPKNLAVNQREITRLETSIASLEREMKDLTNQINKLNKDVDNSDAKKRNLADNLTYRKNKRERDALEKEIEELESRNAQEDYDRLNQEARYLESRRGKLAADRERLMGAMSSKDEQFLRLSEEYEIELKDANTKWNEVNIKTQVTKGAIADLSCGTQALEHAILRYHALKMEEINRTVGELWQSTYQGTDIDTIQIRSNAEPETGGGSTGRRNYNYRVSMVKGDTEMDMRGRCSAGQKVLASIIIRLALAESFGVNCGLIALDEPTTNLDSDNIRSLAESLHAIIQARRGQGNLQLIVITHDEEFLKHMQCSDFCDDFFRVRRDEKQNSVIVRESISRISE